MSEAFGLIWAVLVVAFWLAMGVLTIMGAWLAWRIIGTFLHRGPLG